MACINCGQEVTSNFCPNCGQKASIKRLNVSSLWMDFQSRIYGFDGVFPRTIRDLTIRPGYVTEQFIKGNRISYVGPVGYFFLLVAISLLLMQITELDFYQMVKSTAPVALEQSSKQENFSKLIIDFVYSNFRLFRFGLIPVTSLWIWILYKKQGYNFIESSVPAFYAQGHLEILFIINILLLYFFGFHFNQLAFVIEPAYYGLLFATWGHTPKVRSFLRGVLVWILSYITFVIIFSVAALIWVINQPELLNSLKP